MGIFKKDPPKEDQSKSEAEALLDAFSAKLTETIKPLSDTVTTLKAKWDALEASAQDPPPDPNKNPDGSDLSREDRLEKENKALFALQVQTNARITESALIDEIKTQWPHLVPKIREVLAQIPLAEKAQANYPARCQNAVTMIVGTEAIKSGLRYDSTNGKFLIEDGAQHIEGEENALISGDYDWTDPRNPNKRLTGLEQLQKIGLTKKDFEEMQKNGVV